MLSDIKMSNKLNIISDRSFYGCSSLIEINIPASVQIIDGYYDIGFSGSGGAFAYCSNLKYVIFAENSILNEIGEHAFYNCKSIKSIILPKSVTLIKHGAFSGCSSLEEISLPVVTVNEYNGSRTRNYSFGRIFGSEQYEGGVEIKQNYYTNYNYYGWSEFTCYVPQTLSRVIVTGGNIQDSNFKNCTMIEEVIIHKGVTIGSDPFEHCINVNVYCEKNGSGNLKWSTNYGTYENKTTWNYNNVTSNSEYDYIIRDSGVYLIKYKGTEINVVVPDVIDGYKVVGMDNLFASRSDVTSVVLPSSLYSIDDYSFANCSNLQSIYIPSSVTSIGKYAFSGCSSLVSIILPESVLFIDDYSFEECSSLENIVIPNSVTKIGYKLFEGCDALKYTEYSNGNYLGNEDNKYVILIKTISNSVTECTIHENTKFIYNNAFYKCRSITNITIPESVTSIGQSAFYNCSSLRYIVIPENVIYIGYGAFAECDNLTIYSEIFYAACGWSNNWNYLEYSYGNNKYISVYWRGKWKYVDGVATPIK